MLGIFGPSYDELFTVYTISKTVHTITTLPGQPRVYNRLFFSFSDMLLITEKGGVLKAPQIWGIIRGLETFSQLVYQDHAGKVCKE